MRGMSMPIETIVIIAIVVFVLVVIVAFFVSGSGGAISGITDDQALYTGCAQLTTIYGCNVNNPALGASGLDAIKISNYKASCGGATDSLGAACCRRGFTVFGNDASNPQHCAYLACRCPAP